MTHLQGGNYMWQSSCYRGDRQFAVGFTFYRGAIRQIHIGGVHQIFSVWTCLRMQVALAVDLFALSLSQQVRHAALQPAKARKMSLSPSPLGHIRALEPSQPQGFEFWHFFSSSSLSAFSKSLVTPCNAVKMFSKSACKAAIF